MVIPLSDQQIKSLFDQAQSAAKRGQVFDALTVMARISQAKPNAPEPLWHIGRLNLRLGRPRSARDALERAHKIAPNADAVLSELATARLRCGDSDGALDCMDARIKAKPDAIGARMDKVLALQQLGRFAEADAICAKLHPKLKTDGEFYRIWFAGRNFTSDKDKPLKDALALWKHPRLSDGGRLHLGFALARAFEALGQTDRVFEFLDTSNALQSKAAPYDRAARDALVQAAMSSGASAAQGTSDFAPIIVTGMPRSGTTLIEQILAAHPSARAGGEIGQAQQMLYLTCGANAPPSSGQDHCRSARPLCRALCPLSR